MKNNTLSGRYCFKNPRFKQIFRIMRISTFLLMVCVFCSYAGNAHSQNAKVSIRMNNVKLDKILNEIENQTDYLFIYNNQVDINKITSVKVKNEAVAQVLDRILSGTGINYELEGTHIILTTEAIKDLHAQQQAKTVTGTVTDVSGEPIIGANIRIKGTTTGTITDIDGNFSIKAEPQSVIEVSYIGYLTQETVINNQKSIRFLLKEDTKTLDEVVVIGYGVQKKADLTGSVANINTEKLNTQSNANIGQALQGKIAGVDIVSQGGAPGSGTRIMVRGIGTLNNASPLYIVDGMYMNSIDHINPNDIASIDVLKDASSAAIYGSRAANGVIIVTTKEGSNTEGKPIIDLSVNLGISTASKFLDMLDAKGWAEVTTIARQAIGKPALDMATDLANKPDNDWQDIMFRPALMQNYNLSVKGGGKYSTYYTGLGYFNQDGIVKGTNYQRYNIQSKNDYKRGIFSAGTNLIISFSHDKPLHQELRGGMIGTILQSVPTLEKYDDTREGGYGGTYGDVVNIPHPLAIIDDNIMDRYNENVKIFANLYAQIELFKGLKYKLNLTPDFSFERYKNYLNKYDFGLATNSITQLTERQRRRRNILVENLLTFDRTFGEHKISALAGYTYQDSRFRHIQAYGEGLPQGLEEIAMGSESGSIKGGSTNQNITTSETKAGYPIGGYWLISTAGYFNSQEEVDAYAKDGKKIQPAAEPGDIKFVDANNDGVINDDDRVFQGSPFPDFTFALNGNMRYKNFDLSIGLQGVLGNKIYNATRQTLEDVTKGSNFLASCLDYWTPENKNASHPRLTWDDPNRNTRAESDRYLENGSYLRLRSVQLGYTFPQTWFKGAIQHARVYINAENLFTITSYSGYSPDVNADNANYRGFDNFIYPTNRTFMLGLNVTF